MSFCPNYLLVIFIFISVWGSSGRVYGFTNATTAMALRLCFFLYSFIYDLSLVYLIRMSTSLHHVRRHQRQRQSLVKWFLFALPYSRMRGSVQPIPLSDMRQGTLPKLVHIIWIYVRFQSAHQKPDYISAMIHSSIVLHSPNCFPTCKVALRIPITCSCVMFKIALLHYEN